MVSYDPAPVPLTSPPPAIVHKDLWSNGLLCAYERVPTVKSKSRQSFCWQAIGWKRLTELAVKRENIEKGQREDAPWWAHLDATKTTALTWIDSAPILSGMARQALSNEKQPIDVTMKSLLYEVPVCTKEGLLFELTGHLVGDGDAVREAIAPVLLRCFLSDSAVITLQHVEGVNHSHHVHRYFGVDDVQALLETNEPHSPESAHDVVALLAGRLSTWDDRIWRRYIFQEADEIELKYMNRREEEDLTNFTLILDDDIKDLSKRVIKVKWALHAREEILNELKLPHQSPLAMGQLNEALEDTREMLGEQDSVRDRLFDLQDVLIGARRAIVQDRSLWVQHNLAVVGGAGLVASIIAGVFGVNLDGIPGNSKNPSAFAIFCFSLLLLFLLLLTLGYTTVGMHRRRSKKERAKRELELKDIVTTFHLETVQGHGSVWSKHPLYSTLTPAIGT